MKSVLIASLLFLGSLTTFAAEPIAAKKASQSQAILAELHDSSDDTGERFVRVKEVESGKTTQLTLQKDASTPHVWNGYFAIQFFAGDSGTRTLDFVSAKGEPFFASVSQGKSAQKVTLFKTPRELAEYEAGQATAEASKPVANTEPPKPKIQIAVNNATAAPVPTTVHSGPTQRIDLVEKQERLSPEEKQQRQTQASEAAKKADEAYGAGKYKQALDLYTEAARLDPSNDSYFYRQGVALYKTGNYARSLSVLKGVEVEPEQALERDYYVALNHLKLKDYDGALKELKEIREEKAPELSPTASFFAATIEFQQQKFSDSRKSLEYVLDSSKDPKLDRSAEELLEQIDRAETFLNNKAEKYRFTVFTGLAFDSNVLNVAENNVSTDVKAWRLMYGASAMSYLYRSQSSDLGIQLGYSDYYSVDSNFKANAVLQSADAMELAVSLPYRQEIKSAKHTFSLEVLPSYKNIYLSATGGTRSVAVRSTGLSTTLGLPVESDMVLSGRLEGGSDESLLASSVGDDDLSGSHVGLTVIPLKLLDPKGERAVTAELGYLLNNTNGKNNRYQKTSLAATYSFPGWAGAIASARADYSLQDYRDATVPRKDTVYTVTGSYSKELSKQWNWLTSVQLSSANSEVDVYKYNKYLIMSLFTYTLSLKAH